MSAKPVRRAGRKKNVAPKARAQSPVRIQVPGVDFAPHIDELLKLAGVTSTPDARIILEGYLSLAWAGWDYERENKGRIPTELLKTLENSIRKTQVVLRRLKKYPLWQRFHFLSCPAGEGTVSLPPIAPDGMIAGINIDRMLDKLLREVARSKRRRARPRGEGKRDMVDYACNFFHEHSTAKITTYPGGQFAIFCRRFHEVITGEHLDLDGLQAQIRKKVATLHSEFKSLEKPDLNLRPD